MTVLGIEIWSYEEQQVLFNRGIKGYLSVLRTTSQFGTLNLLVSGEAMQIISSEVSLNANFFKLCCRKLMIYHVS